MDQATLDAHEDALRHADRGTLLLATSFGFLLFLMVVACVPGLPPNLRSRSHPSASMPPNQPDHAMRYIKRVVDLPGGCVQMIKGRLSLNREPAATEPVAGAAAATEGPLCGPLPSASPAPPAIASSRQTAAMAPSAITPAFAVPAGNVFVPSDNRANSIDRRHQTPNFGAGLVPTEPLDGRVIATLGGVGE